LRDLGGIRLALLHHGCFHATVAHGLHFRLGRRQLGESLLLGGGKPRLVKGRHGIPAGVGEYVEAAVQSHGIGFVIAAADRVVLAMPIVEQPRLGVTVLAGKTESVVARLDGNRTKAEGIPIRQQ